MLIKHYGGTFYKHPVIRESYTVEFADIERGSRFREDLTMLVPNLYIHSVIGEDLL